MKTQMTREQLAKAIDQARHKAIVDEGGVYVGNDRIGRNDSCPCGSGTKFKKCHGPRTVRIHGRNYLA